MGVSRNSSYIKGAFSKDERHHRKPSVKFKSLYCKAMGRKEHLFKHHVQGTLIGAFKSFKSSITIASFPFQPVAKPGLIKLVKFIITSR